MYRGFPGFLEYYGDYASCFCPRRLSSADALAFFVYAEHDELPAFGGLAMSGASTSMSFTVSESTFFFRICTL